MSNLAFVIGDWKERVMADIHAVNLLPDTKQQRLRLKRTRQVAVSIATLVLIVAIAAPVLLVVARQSQQVLLDRTQKQIDERKKTLKETDNISTMLTVKDHLASLPSLYDQRTFATELLAVLPGVMPQEIRLTNIEVDVGAGTISFAGSSPTYGAVEKFFRAVQQAGIKVDANRVDPNPDTSGYFTSVVLEDVSGPSGSEVTFTIKANFDAQLTDGVANAQD
ncbi:hypothetical protein HY441_00635 [Candidatus Microgenomates bacterium]|nr:hypothetical protein [Candidatus Microgenomates bacterium]